MPEIWFLVFCGCAVLSSCSVPPQQTTPAHSAIWNAHQEDIPRTLIDRLLGTDSSASEARKLITEFERDVDEFTPSGKNKISGLETHILPYSHRGEIVVVPPPRQDNVDVRTYFQMLSATHARAVQRMRLYREEFAAHQHIGDAKMGLAAAYIAWLTRPNEFGLREITNAIEEFSQVLSQE